ncbi:MAG: branched-chain amino acid ABC transporter permease [Deltaproteobacteria bacterium]|nr:branched-chain amino acid ABC transporter permease [Deltaproteobacteria bacterium]MBW2044344.1 branched-chain amino acid ABC transporter permease [Deltaproteobacteria bacterium]MBW2301271.1 branched-chain amino acid ABC transporter permease [Deltaproteobacteria bacterium]
MTFEQIFINLLNGISFGVILFLLASGLTMVYGIMGIVNLAHGALYMVGAYVGWSVAIQHGFSYWMATLTGGIVAGFVGLVMERATLRYLYRQINEQVLVTIGFIYVLTNLTQWIWGPRPRAPFTAGMLSGTIQFWGCSYPIHRLTVILIGIVISIAIWWFQEKTRIGAMIQAGMDDKEMTMGLGINLNRISVILFFICSFVAGFAGVIGAQLLGATLGQGFHILGLALVVVIIGGTGSVGGALIGGLILGIFDSFINALVPQIGMWAMYLIAVIVLLVRPQGIMGGRMK